MWNLPSEPFYCRKCDKWYRTVSNISCCVNHHDGHCHYSDKEVERPFYGITDPMEVMRHTL